MQSSAKKAVRNLEKIVDMVVVAFFLAFLVYGVFAMWDTNRMYAGASSIAYTAYRPSPEETLGFEDLQAINPNVFGWITIFGTQIDYPLLQGPDNIRYVYTNAHGQPSRAGAIFLDVRNNQDFTNFNNIIYGHDMTRNAMFGELASFAQSYVFETRRFGTIFTGEHLYGIEFFAFVEADAHDFEIYNPLVSDPALKEAILYRFETESLQWRNIDVTINDRLVVLSTCTATFTNGRHLLIGRLMADIPEDIFVGTTNQTGLDAIIGGVTNLGLITGAIFIILFTISMTFIIARMIKNKKIKAGLIPTVEIVPMQKKKTTLKDDIIFLFGKIFMVGIMITLLFSFVFGLTEITDASMNPAMNNGDLVLFQRINQDVIAGDVVVVNMGGNTYVRRVVAIAGETVDINGYGRLIINGFLQIEQNIFEDTEAFAEGINFPIIVGADEVFVLGDSRARSRDSRIYGSVSTNDILGTVVTVIRGGN